MPPKDKGHSVRIAAVYGPFLENFVLRSWLFQCRHCRAVLGIADTKVIKKADAEAAVRRKGWVQNGDDWFCREGHASQYYKLGGGR